MTLLFTCERYEFGETYAHGEVFIEHDVEREHVCFSLEDMDRKLEEGGIKVYGMTAIPLGTYRLTTDRSKRFGVDMMHLLNVPQFSGIRIHAGNDSEDTDGCPLAGLSMPMGDWISDSRAAVERIFRRVQKALADGEECYWTVKRR